MFQEETRKYIQERFKKPQGTPNASWGVLYRNVLYTQDDTDDSRSKDLFCLQMQIKKHQAEKESCETQHLVTNLQYKLKPHGKKTKFLRAKIDTCSNANVMPASIYKILYNDPDYTKLLPSKKNGIKTYTKQRIPVIGSCELFVLHQHDKCFHKVKFQVVSVEGSVIILCATSINLNLIQIPNQLDTKIPDCTRLVYSCADAPYKHQYKNSKAQPEQCFLARNAKNLTCGHRSHTKTSIWGHRSQYKSVTEDCVRIKPANQQDASS